MFYLNYVPTVNIDDYSEVKECDYKGEHYSVRDNGAILRHRRLNRPIRPNDEKWSFGKKQHDGYMLFGGARVHIIVATAFYGPKDSSVFVVDHIDTNRCNNRPENLRWLTRLENVLKNEITRKRVIAICGSIEEFLKNPNLLYDHVSDDKNFEWMRTVTKEEADISLKRMTQWAKQPVSSVQGGKVGEWVFENANMSGERRPNVAYYNDFLLPRHFEIDKSRQNFYYVQVKWTQECQFLMCPIYSFPEDDTLQVYIKALVKDEWFLQTYDYYALLKDYHLFEDEKKLRILCERRKFDKRKVGSSSYLVFEIYVKGNIIYHEHVGTIGKYEKAIDVMNDLTQYVSKHRWNNRQNFNYSNSHRKFVSRFDYKFSDAWDKKYGKPGTPERQKFEDESFEYLKNCVPLKY